MYGEWMVMGIRVVVFFFYIISFPFAPRSKSPFGVLDSAVESATWAIVGGWSGKRCACAVLVSETDERVAIWRVLRPMQMSAQSRLRIAGKTRPRTHHVAHGAVLLWRVGHPRHILCAAHDHVQVAAMIGAAVRVQAQVGPIAKIAILPDRNAGVVARRGFGEGGAGEAFEVEKIPRVVGKGEVQAVGPDFVEAGFVVGDAC